jgi:hypothetical protein
MIARGTRNFTIVDRDIISNVVYFHQPIAVEIAVQPTRICRDCRDQNKAAQQLVALEIAVNAERDSTKGRQKVGGTRNCSTVPRCHGY